jgi:hypothetical protein
VPSAPAFGDNKEINGGVSETTVKFTPLLEAPFTATITEPVLASGGTGTTILVSDHEAGVAVNPLKEMVLAPLSAPKLVPVIVIESPAIPEFVDKLVIN